MNSQQILLVIRTSGAYTKYNHQDWVDEQIFGVSHLGIPPMLQNIGSLVFDCSHGQSLYIKLQIDFLQNLFEENFDSIEKFSIF